MSRSLKNLYPKKYAEFINSEKYKLRIKIQYTSNAAKEKCKEDANYTCAICGNNALDAHHIVPVEKGGSDEQSNLICLCRACHQRVHKNVYEIEPETKKITPIIKESDIIDSNSKQNYILAFEKENNLTLYRSSCGYYAFINNIKTYFDVKAIKASVNYKPESVKTISAEKSQSIKDRKMLSYLASEYKAQGDKKRWHMYSKLARNWDTYEESVKEQIMSSILK